MASLDIYTPLIFKLNSSAKPRMLFSFKYPYRHKHRPSFSLTNAAHTQTALPFSSRTTTPKYKIESEQDPISILNERIRRQHHGKREGSNSKPIMDSEEADQYIQMVKEQQQRGLQKLKGDRVAKEGDVFSYKVDPYTLSSGDYVVHKKVGIGRFVGIKFDMSKGSSEAIEYVFIEYADGMAKLPVKQASPMLYRYNLMSDLLLQSKAEKEMYLEMTKHGHLDIIVGTHSLLGSRVVYNNLGLLVGDEEQRFGVKQKEKIASFKTSVDVLTLTATPIPWTLYLALTGFWDASLISTPPPERVPIKTHLSAHSKERLISAIKYELDRGGQVFYVLPHIKGCIKDNEFSALHNLVSGDLFGTLPNVFIYNYQHKRLEEVKDFLEQSFSNVEIAVAHGQSMIAWCLEKTPVCTHFIRKAILKAARGHHGAIHTSSSPQANNPFLYVLLLAIFPHLLKISIRFTQIKSQLRGRVGRVDKEARAHLFYPDKSMLTDQALERLAALEKCQELGRGFQLAEIDMGIQGCGTIFGEQQTGDVGNVGIDFFFEMLFESLSKVDEHRVISVPYQSVQVDLNINPHLPSDYINSLENPVEIINEAEKAAETDIWSLMQFTENLRCQYGKEPCSMEILLKKLYIRRMAADIGITRIYASGKMVGMETNMCEKVFKLMADSMSSDIHRNSLVFDGNQIKKLYYIQVMAGGWDCTEDTWVYNGWIKLFSPLQSSFLTEKTQRIGDDDKYHTIRSA
ncbi:hypothetical protein Peur_011915 [Populus x canadensis]